MIDRRSFFTSGALAAGALALATRRTASADPMPPTTPPAKKPAPDTRQPLLDALAACIAKAYACQAHCASQLGAGNREFVRCNAAVADVLLVGEALRSLVSRGSVNAKKLADTCAAVCKECSAACLEHKAHFAHGMHLECKECMDACDACAKACAAFVA